mmetsp:Transcript_19453/g.29458  ORF Transcript_19453/g.29458 Transcript_19453/m.29458 type:complete len:416 (-) Transcript_19453:66-1313(-)
MRPSDDEKVVPFEWLTNFTSLQALLDPEWLFDGHDNEDQDKTFRVLHVGCGSSTLGEILMLSFPRYNYVVNADNDIELLTGMKKRWHSLVQKYATLKGGDIGTLEYVHMDFIKNTAESFHPQLDSSLENKTNGSFELILDKSTLDCLLCSSDGASGLICEVYKQLKPGGVYFLITFNHEDFIAPLLEDCPGTRWEVTKTHAERNVDAPNVVKRNEALLLGSADVRNFGKDESNYSVARMNPKKDQEPKEEDRGIDSSSVAMQSAWTSGTFSPNQNYGRYLNVFICRRNSNCYNFTLNKEAVTNHIHKKNDEYFKQSNPMLTHVRKKELKRLFLKILEYESIADKGSIRSEDEVLSSIVVPLEECYEIMFTDAEKEVLDYCHFLEDWEAFSPADTSNESISGMTFKTAIAFLEMMQ